jgi:hypothetical protein
MMVGAPGLKAVSMNNNNEYLYLLFWEINRGKKLFLTISAHLFKDYFIKYYNNFILIFLLKIIKYDTLSVFSYLFYNLFYNYVFVNYSFCCFIDVMLYPIFYAYFLLY